MSGAAILTLAALGLVLAIVAAAVVQERRRRREVDTLMARLQTLEERLAFGEGGPTEPSVEEAILASRPELSADVLAGRTSMVARLVSTSNRPADLAEQAIVGIYRRIEEAIRPSDLADELNVSLRTLQRGIERALGCTPSELILTVKMREARRLIEDGGLRVGEVAHRLAFADAAHLSRRYRRFYRCPPSAHAASRGDSAAVN